MNNDLPKVLYRVTRTGGVYSYGSTGGKTFADLRYAKNYQRKLRAASAESEIYVCEPDWKLLDELKQA